MTQHNGNKSFTCYFLAVNKMELAVLLSVPHSRVMCFCQGDCVANVLVSQLLNHRTNYQEIWYEPYAIMGHQNLNFSW
jgi:hypothetical protein